MGWVWKEVKDETGWAHFWDWEDEGDGKKPDLMECYTDPNKKVIKSDCKTEEVEPGKFVRKCHNVMEIVKKERDGKPAEVLESKTYYTEEDVTNNRNKNFKMPSDCSKIDMRDLSPFLWRPSSESSSK